MPSDLDDKMWPDAETLARHERVLTDNEDETGVFIGLVEKDLITVGSARGDLRTRVTEERERFPNFVLRDFIPTHAPEQLEELSRAEFRKMGTAVKVEGPCIKDYLQQTRKCGDMRTELEMLPSSIQGFLATQRSKREIYAYVDELFDSLPALTLMTDPELTEEHRLMLRLMNRSKRCGEERQSYREKCISEEQWDYGHQIAIDWANYISTLALKRIELIHDEAAKRSEVQANQKSQVVRREYQPETGSSQQTQFKRKTKGKTKRKIKTTDTESGTDLTNLDELIRLFELQTVDPTFTRETQRTDDDYELVTNRVLTYLNQIGVVFPLNIDYEIIINKYIAWVKTEIYESWESKWTENSRREITEIHGDKLKMAAEAARNPQMSRYVQHRLLRDIQWIRKGHEVVPRDMYVPEIKEAVRSVASEQFGQRVPEQYTNELVVLVLLAGSLPVGPDDTSHHSSLLLEGALPSALERRQLGLGVNGGWGPLIKLIYACWFRRQFPSRDFKLRLENRLLRPRGWSDFSTFDKFKERSFRAVEASLSYDATRTSEELEAVTRLCMAALLRLWLGTFPWELSLDPFAMTRELYAFPVEKTSMHNHMAKMDLLNIDCPPGEIATYCRYIYLSHF